MFVGVFSENTIRIGVSANFGHPFFKLLGQKVGSIRGPCFPLLYFLYYLQRLKCGPLIDPIYIYIYVCVCVCNHFAVYVLGGVLVNVCLVLHVSFDMWTCLQKRCFFLQPE